MKANRHVLNISKLLRQKMGNKEDFIKIIIKNIANSYKTAVTLTSVALAENNIQLTKDLHTHLNNIFSKLKDNVYVCEDDCIIEKIKNDNFENLPEWLTSIKMADYSRKLLALKYTNTDCDNIEDKIMINKMAIELNPQEDIPYIKIGRALFEDGHTIQALKLCEYIKTFSDTIPLLSLLGDVCRSLGMYAESIDAYSNILKIKEDDEETLAKIDEICEEALL